MANLFTGISTFYFSNGQISREVPWENGKKNGTEKYYYPSGRIKEEVFWCHGIFKGQKCYGYVEEING